MLQTTDRRYVIKTLPKEERDVLLKILPQYCDFLSENPTTLLVRFVGLHEIKIGMHGVCWVDKESFLG